MKRLLKKPELPPIKLQPENSDRCICFGYGAWYDYKTEPVSIKSCDRCDGVGYLVRTHNTTERCPDRFPGFCSSCGCKCEDCRRQRMRTPRWEEFEAAYKRSSEPFGRTEQFIAWGTDPFMTEYGGVFRIAVIQPWPTAGYIWQFVSVDSFGNVAIMHESFARSLGSFYDALPHECNSHQSGDALTDAKSDAREAMLKFLRL